MKITGGPWKRHPFWLFLFRQEEKNLQWIILKYHSLPYIFSDLFTAGIYFFKLSNGNTISLCETCSKLTITTPERRQWHRSGHFIVTFEKISHIFLVFPLRSLNMQIPAGSNKSFCNSITKESTGTKLIIKTLEQRVTLVRILLQRH